MITLDRALKSPFLVPGMLVVLLVLQSVVLVRRSVGQHADATGRAAQLVNEAKSAFQRNDNPLAIALLSAALIADPSDGQALDLYQERCRQRFQSALQDRDWNSAEIQVAAYDSTVRAALRGALTKSAVEKLVARQHEVEDWEARLNSTREDSVKHEADAIQDQFLAATPETLATLEARLRALPTEGLSQETTEKLATLALSLTKVQRESALASIKDELTNLRQGAGKEGLDSMAMREIRVRVEHVHSRIIEAQLQGANVESALAACQDLLSQLDQRLQVMSIRQMQTIADSDAMKSLSSAKTLLNEAEQTNGKPYQWRGEKLAEAEVQLARIDRLCSAEIQDQARQVLESVRKKTISYRTLQARDYNLWAIRELEESIGDYDKAVGWFYNDRKKFMEIMETKVGRIDPQPLHPVTYALFAEMYQKLLGKLKPDEKVLVTKTVENVQRRPISDF